MPHSAILLADKGYDSDAIRRQVEAKGTMPNIPPKSNRRWKNCFSPILYRNRNSIERMFGRLKDFRRIATRYADNFLAAVSEEKLDWYGEAVQANLLLLWRNRLKLRHAQRMT